MDACCKLFQGSDSLSEQLEGINSVWEALRGGREIEKIYLDEARKDQRIKSIITLAARHKVPVQTVNRKRLQALSCTGMNQGVVAIAADYRYYEVEAILESAFAEDKKPFLIMLDGIEDPQNLGSIIRTAECAGVDGIILPRHGSAPITPAVVRASAGAVEHMKIARVTNLANTIDFLKKTGMWVVGTAPDARFLYHEADIPTPVALIIGGEDRGIRRLVREKSDMVLRIPLYGRISSLNASVACALVAYEVVRQGGNGRS